QTAGQADASAQPEALHEEIPIQPLRQTPQRPAADSSAETGEGFPKEEDRTIVQPGLFEGPNPPDSSQPPPGQRDRTEIVVDADLITRNVPDPEHGKDPADRTTVAARTSAPEDFPSDPAAPSVPGYTILHRLGRGTYGEVWLAQEERTGIRVAIKFFAHGTNLQWQLIQAEVKQLARLHADPGIVQLLDVELDASPPYYVMAYAPGGS